MGNTASNNNKNKKKNKHHKTTQSVVTGTVSSTTPQAVEQPGAATAVVKNKTKEPGNKKSAIVSASSSSSLSHTTKATTTSSLLMEQVTASLKEPNAHDVWQDYEKVQLVANGSTCEVWTVKRRQKSLRLPLSTTTTTEVEQQEERDATSANQQAVHDYGNNKDRNEGATTTTTTDEDTSVSSSTTTLYALKIISKASMSDAVLKEMRNEVGILRTLDHPHILRVYNWYESETHSYMVMEYLSGGHLLKHHKHNRYTEAQVAHIMRQILSAMVYLHKRGIVHRDVKPENVVYATGASANNHDNHDNQEPVVVKLIDFGLSKEHITNGQVNMHCKVGTLLSMSPQVIQGKYTNKADIWSVGTIAYTLLSHTRPFDGATNRDIINAILDRGRYKPMTGPPWETISELAKDFCQQLLQYEPKHRPTAKQALDHPWLKQYKSSMTTTTTMASSASTTTSNTTTDNSSNNNMAATMSRIHNALLASSLYDNTNTAIFEQLVAMMVAHETPNELLQEYRHVFTVMDPNNSGKITYWQFRAALSKNQCNLSEDTMKDIFARLDLDHNGSIQYTEFLALALLAQGQFQESEIAAAFVRMDVDCDGYISRQDLCAALGSAYCQPGHTCNNVVASILQRYDVDKDDQISYDEFLAIFREKYRKGLDDKCCAVLEHGQR